MDELKDGVVVYHKATGKRCVVIKKTDNGMIVVRDEDNQEQHYYPQELQVYEGIKIDRNSYRKPFFDPDKKF